MITDVLERIAYKDGWTLHLGHDCDRLYIQWRMPTTDIRTGEPITLINRKRFLWDGITETELVQEVFSAARALEEHEMAERFLYQSVRVFNQHTSVSERIKIADIEDASRGT